MPLEQLKEALERTQYDRRCIAENRGEGKELAREAYQDGISELMEAIGYALADLPPRAVETFARRVIKKLEGK